MYFNETGIWGGETIGVIKPLLESNGNVSDPENYRGITLLSCFGKLFINVINCRLTDFLNTFNAIGTEQAGFKAGHSTVDHMFVLKSSVDIYLSRNWRLYCCFVDYRKAFDTVNRSKLWSKILSLNINGKLFNPLTSRLECMPGSRYTGVGVLFFVI